MDLLETLTTARARAAAAPSDAAAWLALADVLEVADRGALDADAGFQLAVDRWDALTRVAMLMPTIANLRAQVTCVALLSRRATDRGHPDLAVAMAREQAEAAHTWLRLALRTKDPAPEDAAKLLVGGAQTDAEHFLARGEGDDAALALVMMLAGLHTLAQRTGRPEHALQIAGVHLHLSGVAKAPEGARVHLTSARDVLDKLDAAGLTHPVQAQVREQVEARLRALDGD
jgi:hypothetical protein